MHRSSALGWLPIVATDSLIGVLGVWQVLALIAVYGGLSFNGLFVLGFLSFIGLGLPLVTRPWEEPEPSPDVALPPKWATGGALVLALGAWAAFHLRWVDLPTVAFLVAPLAWVFVAPRQAPVLGTGRATWFDALAVLFVAVSAAAVTLNLRRPDVDDGYYLNAVIQTLEQSHLPSLGFDGIHGVPGAPIQQVVHRPQTFELLVAWICQLTGMSARWAYWVIIPAGFATLMPLTHWAFAKRLAPSLAAVATLISFGALLCWGDGAQTIGRFGFVRLFQGKSVFLTVMMPLLGLAMVHYAAAPSWRSWLRLLVAAVAVTTFTSTALIVVPIAIALGGLGGLRMSWESVKQTVLAWTTAIPVIAILLLLYVELQAAGGLVSDGHIMRATAALGSARSAMVLLGIAAAPWLLRGQGGAVWIARFVGVAMLVLLNGVTPGLLGKQVAGLLNWRTFWAVPFAPILGLAVAGGLRGLVQAWPNRSPMDGLRAAVAVALIGGFVMRGTWAVQNEGIGYRFAAEKTIDRFEKVADVVMEWADPTEVVAGPPQVTQAVAMRPGKPKLVAVWIRYVINLRRFWGQDETDRRLELLRYARGKDFVVPRRSMQLQCVSVLITVQKHHGKGNTATVLPELGFEKVAVVQRHDVWSRPPETLPVHCVASPRYDAKKAESLKE